MNNEFTQNKTQVNEKKKKTKGMTMKDESPRLEGVQYTTGEEQRPTNSPGKN